MLSYLHAFHAGNFADVHKHSALVLALRMMQAKASAIAVFDTHAGSASYDLDHERARKTAEADSGIQKVWPHRAALVSDDWTAMLDPLSEVNAGERVTSYPGSPAWVAHHLREQDRLCAWELHPTESRSLADWAVARPGIHVIADDGLSGLLRRLPPKQPRLLVLVDPSYEVKTEYQAVADTLQQAWQKCRHGVFLVWYPILESKSHELLKQSLQSGPIRKVLYSEIMLNTPPGRGMLGSGVLVVNPPWGFDSRLQAMMSAVAGDDCLGVDSRMQWLVPE